MEMIPFEPSIVTVSAVVEQLASVLDVCNGGNSVFSGYYGAMR